MPIRRSIPLVEVGEFFGVDPNTISSIHLNAAKDEVQFEISVYVYDPDKPKQKLMDRRRRPVKDTLRIAVIDSPASA